MLLGVLQENLLTLLAVSEQHALLIRNTVDVGLFGAHYKIIAARIYDYIDKYKTPPKGHLADILEDKLNSDNKHEATLYVDVITSIHEASETINTEYVMAQLETFVRRQSLRSIAVDLVKALQRDSEESLEEAEALIGSAQHQSLNLFDPGTRLSDKDKALQFLERDKHSFPIGIPELDRRGLGPTRKEVWLFIANAKRGKTWSLIQISKMALMQRLKVSHVTLEVSEEITTQRYFQAMFAMAKRPGLLKTTKFEKDELGRITGFENKNITPVFTMADDDVREKLETRIDMWKDRLLKNIIIKQFPTGALTVPKLKAYLDSLESTQQFVPDLLVVDYPDLMKLDASNYRLSLDAVYKDLRGMAIERNVALAIVSQSHRGAARATTVDADNVAEAYSKIAHADTVITYSQTKAEQQLGLARLYVAAARNDQDKFTVVISQQYGIGNFVVDSCLMTGNYFENLPHSEETDD